MSTLRLAAVSLFLLCTAAAAALAQPSRLTGFGLLRLEPSARATALAGAYGAGPGGDVNALFANPALLDETSHRRLSVSYLNHLADINAGFAAYGHHTERLGGTLGGAVRFLSYGDFERADADGTRAGDTFGASEAILTLAYARPAGERLHLGASAHAVFSSIDDASAQAFAIDLGATYRLPERGFALSASLRNLGVVAGNLGAEDDVLPLDLRFSVSKQLQYVPILITVAGYDLTSFENENGSALNEIARHLSVGGELRFGAPFAVRVGYNHRLHEELSTGERLDLAGLGLGFGLNLRRFGFDYAYNAWSSFGGLHHLTLRTQL
ncbi:MAG: type IX secretion system protein PorQ [Bacteroidota bacterium]